MEMPKSLFMSHNFPTVAGFWLGKQATFFRFETQHVLGRIQESEIRLQGEWVLVLFLGHPVADMQRLEAIFEIRFGGSVA